MTNRSRVLMVGDDLLADIKGGINAGIDTCWVNFANEENKTGIQPKYTVHSYEELYRIVMEPEELENVGVRNRRHMNEAETGQWNVPLPGERTEQRHISGLMRPLVEE
mgnify:CR=1 FL=1